MSKKKAAGSLPHVGGRLCPGDKSFLPTTRAMHLNRQEKCVKFKMLIVLLSSMFLALLDGTYFQ